MVFDLTKKTYFVSKMNFERSVSQTTAVLLKHRKKTIPIAAPSILNLDALQKVNNDSLLKSEPTFYNFMILKCDNPFYM